MTLKEHLKNNKIFISGERRGKIGYAICNLDHKYTYVKENHYKVKDYEEKFLNSLEVSNIIIETLKKLES